MRLTNFIETHQKREWLLEGLIPKGHIILLPGLPGVGKSWIVDGIATHIACGKPFLGLPVIQGPVILIDEDTPCDELSNRLQRLSQGLNSPLGNSPLEVRSMQNINLSDEDTICELEKFIGETHSVLIILDCLSKVMGGEFNENNARYANIAGKVLGRLKAKGVTVILTHHLNKREGSLETDFVKLTRGSGAIVANSDTAFGIESGSLNPTRFNVFPIE